MQKKAGFTLIELILVIIILGIVAAMSSTSLIQAFTSYTTSQSSSLLDWQANVALERMTRELRSIGSAANIQSKNPTSIQFIDGSSNNITYSIISGNLVETNSGVQNVLASNATSIAFKWFDRTGAVTSNNSQIRYAKMTLAIAAGGVSYTYQTSVFLPNIP